ncbi:hypothetical protein ES695_02855 [Candidatus Atribacteria bacterium 1244-E10-H5-B2]|nr:MAG: hypothetical protein ES695_02855 [Candidatus Atribacteria bacterium 1244-E10-H5-B2]
MAITGNKFEAYHSIMGNRSLYETKDKGLQIETIIRVAKEQYDVNLTKKDIEEMKKDYTRYIFFYKMLL